MPIDKVDVAKHIKENLLKEYPLTATELCNQVKIKASCSQGDVWRAIKPNEVKDDLKSAYAFGSKTQEDNYKASGILPIVLLSIYKTQSIDYLAT